MRRSAELLFCRENECIMGKVKCRDESVQGTGTESSSVLLFLWDKKKKYGCCLKGALCNQMRAKERRR